MNILATITTHSAGINWGQALAIWVPIVGGMLAIIVTIMTGIRGIKKWQEDREAKANETEKQRLVQSEQITERLLLGFANTLNVRFGEIDDHLSRQDNRFSRIDRALDIDST